MAFEPGDERLGAIDDHASELSGVALRGGPGGLFFAIRRTSASSRLVRSTAARHLSALPIKRILITRPSIVGTRRLPR